MARRAPIPAICIDIENTVHKYKYNHEHDSEMYASRSFRCMFLRKNLPLTTYANIILANAKVRGGNQSSIKYES